MPPDSVFGLLDGINWLELQVRKGLRALQGGIILTLQDEIGRVRTGLGVPPLLLDQRAADPLFAAHCPGGGIGRRASFRCWLS